MNRGRGLFDTGNWISFKIVEYILCIYTEVIPRARDIATTGIKFAVSFSICAGKKTKKKKKKNQAAARDTSAENRFLWGAVEKVSRIRAPGRRHLDMGSSCTLR